jgi:RNA polymerase sigma-70 factor (ECF subfamily)
MVMSDPAASQDRTLEQFRAYLCLLARVQFDPRLQGKLDLSGVIQRTLLEAYQALARIEGWSETQKMAWLRKALANNLKDAIRKLRTAGRDVARERSLEAALDESSSQLGAWLMAKQSSPSQQAERHEQALRLAEALARLPEAQRDALVLQHWHGWSLAQIAEHLGRSPGAVAGLLHRGLQQLKKYLQPRE